MTDERTNGSLRACEADATCHAPAVHRVNVLRPGWKVPESRQYCIMHAAQVLPVDAPATTVTAYDAPVRRPLRAEVLAALRSEPRHLSVIREALTRPALPMTVRRELDALIEEGLAVEGPPSHFARQEAAVKPKTKTPPSALTQHERVLEDVRAHPWTSVGDIMRRTEDEVAPVEAEESPEWGVADAPEEAFGRPMTLAERLARATGVDLTRGDVGLVEAVERIVAERDAAKARADRLDAMGSELVTDFLGGLRSALDVPAGDWSAAELITMVDAFRSEVVDELDRAGAPNGLDVRRRVVWLREQLIAAAAERDSAIGELNTLRRERETLIAQCDEVLADHHAERELLDRTDNGSPAHDGRAVQALLDAHGYPLREFGPVVRVQRLLDLQGVDLPERGE